MNHTSFFLVFLSLFLSNQAISSNVQVVPDSIPQIEIRTFDSLMLAENRNLDRYDYSIQRGEGNTLWDRVKAWFQNVLGILFSNSATGTILEVILYVLAIAAIVYALLRFSGISIPSLIKKSSDIIAYQVETEDIHSIDFESEIEEAIDQKNLRLALRLYYLWTLKILSDSGNIVWQAGKTNGDYYYEITTVSIKDSFRKLSRLFEYGWYGGFKLENPNIEEVRSLHQSIKSTTSPDVSTAIKQETDG